VERLHGVFWGRVLFEAFSRETVGGGGTGSMNLPLDHVDHPTWLERTEEVEVRRWVRTT